MDINEKNEARKIEKIKQKTDEYGTERKVTMHCNDTKKRKGRR